MFDFSKADTFDRHWWLKLAYFLDELEKRNLRELYRLQHAHSLNGLAVLTDESKKENLQRAADILTRYGSDLFPWVKELGGPENRQKSIIDMAAMWEDVWGKQDDPETQKRIWATVEALKPRAGK